MSKTLQSLIEEFSDADQQRIERKAAQMAADMVQHADSLPQAGTAPVKTQDEVAGVPNVTQNAGAQP